MTDAILQIGMCIFIAFLGYGMYSMYKSYQASNVYERRYVAAYRVGLIKKKADENGISLELPPESDSFTEEIEGGVVERINRPPQE